MKPRTNTRDHPIGPHTLGGDLLPGDLVLRPRGDVLIRVVKRDEHGGWQGEYVDDPAHWRQPSIFWDDLYVLVEKAKEGS